MSEETASSTIIVDIGKRKRKAVKQLRRGKGKLMHRVQETIEDLKANGEIDPSAQTVVVVVEKKSRRVGLKGFRF